MANRCSPDKTDGDGADDLAGAMSPYVPRPVSRVLGIDPGLTRCGIGVVEGLPGRPPALVAVDVIRTPPGDDIAEVVVNVGADVGYRFLPDGLLAVAPRQRVALIGRDAGRALRGKFGQVDCGTAEWNARDLEEDMNFMIGKRGGSHTPPDIRIPLIRTCHEGGSLQAAEVAESGLFGHLISSMPLVG